jgi:hypothetical protein
LRKSCERPFEIAIGSGIHLGCGTDN